MISASLLPLGVRGYRREETDELLRRVASEYLLVLNERDALAREVRQLEQLCDDLATDKALLRTELKALESELAARPLSSASTPGGSDGAALLASAERDLRELREATRVECQAMLARTRREAAEIERLARARAKSVDAEVQRLLRVQDDLRAKLRGFLESTLRELPPPHGREKRSGLDDDLTRSLPRRP